jgi:membrane fusion protein (multidrug efflux system)
VVGGLLLITVGLAFATLIKRSRIDEERKSARAGGKEATPVVVYDVEARDVIDRLRLPGKAEAWTEVWVSAQAAGTLKSIEVAEGRDVREGDVLCRIEDKDYKAAVDGARAMLDGAKAAKSLAEVQLRRMTELRRTDTVGQSDYDQAEAGLRQTTAAVGQAEAGLEQAKIQLERTVVRAPVSGTIAKIPVEVGQLLGPGTRVARIVELGRIKVTVGIPEVHANKAAGVDEVALTLKAIPGRTFTGKRVYLGVEPQEKSHVYPLDLVVDNGDRLIRPGMFITADVVLEVRKRPVIPLISIIPREKDKVVFVASEGVARRRPVEIGLIMGSSLPEAEVEITSGIRAGDKLIVQGQRRVEDGDPVSVHTPSAE